MKFTLSWLRDHLDTSASIEALAEKLSSIGLEVESIDDPGARLKNFTIARVLDAKRHPNADRLQVCKLDIGGSTVEVVCGAPNARSGMIGVFAPIGSYIPGTKMTLEAKPVRGVVSGGMLLSEREMQLSDNHEGIIELPESYAARIGQRYVDTLAMGDPVLDVKITPNRPDCTGVRGIARDLAAAGLGKLKPDPKFSGVEGSFDCPIDIKLEFSADTKDACSCFTGRYLKGVKNGEAPEWMKQRLKAVGLRPINALVDVTNYISLDRGRPLHVYDADKLKGAIRARMGRKGEKFAGLDGKTHEVDETMCVIADDSAVLGLGGILGGEDTGVTTDTKNVLIECAYFDPLRTAATGRKSGVQSDARYRFERGVDPAFVVPGLDLATDMMMKVAGGTPSNARVAGSPPSHKKIVTFNFGMVEKLAGIAIPQPQAQHTLEALGFSIEGKGATVKVAVPSWRPDVEGPADLVEEIARIAGLDNVPSAPMSRIAGVARPVLTEAQRRVRRARRILAGRGLVEAITWSFIDHDAAKTFGGGQDALELANPISSEMTSMRPSLLPGLLAALLRNRNRGFADTGLFEVGQCYRGDAESDQFMAASAVRAGAKGIAGAGRHWDGTPAGAGLFEAKSDVLALLADLGFDASKAQISRDAPAWFHPGRSAALKLGPKTMIAHFGEIHPQVLAGLGLTGPVAACEVFLGALPPRRKTTGRGAFESLALLPVTRDFAFVVDAQVLSADVVKAAAATDKSLVTGVRVFDVFEGESIGKGKKSLALEVTLQPREKTLTDAEIDAVAARIVTQVEKATGAKIRG
jgi:phenylalanyl-tRNA synthetase beta chain